jgi:hypothetical protein
MILQEARKEIEQLERFIEFGDKALIASAIGEKYENVIAVFRGMGGKKLTVKVVREAYKIKREREKEMKQLKKFKTQTA